jgi:hypothetical protein
MYVKTVNSLDNVQLRSCALLCSVSLLWGSVFMQSGENRENLDALQSPEVEVGSLQPSQVNLTLGQLCP